MLYEHCACATTTVAHGICLLRQQHSFSGSSQRHRFPAMTTARPRYENTTVNSYTLSCSPAYPDDCTGPIIRGPLTFLLRRRRNITSRHGDEALTSQSRFPCALQRASRGTERGPGTPPVNLVLTMSAAVATAPPALQAFAGNHFPAACCCMRLCLSGRPGVFVTFRVNARAISTTIAVSRPTGTFAWWEYCMVGVAPPPGGPNGVGIYTLGA